MDDLRREGQRGRRHAGWNRNNEEWAERWKQMPEAERRRWKRRGRRMFLRFLMSFGMIVLLIVGSMAMLAGLLTRWFTGVEGWTPITIAVWLGGIGVTFLFPMMAFYMATRAYRGIAQPITEVMNAADAVAEGNLSARVGGEYNNDFGRLAQSFNRMAEELELSDQRRRNLTADVAHELRTPLHIIQGNLEGVLDGVYEPTAEHLEATLAETQLLARLVEDLRTLSQAEAGQLPLRLERVDVAELLADVETSFSGQAEAAEITLTVSAPENLDIEADYGRMTQVVNNLVMNAIRHTAAGGAITIEAEPVDGQVRLTVQDTGEGIPAEELPYIFDRFWRGDRSRPHTGSTGLGLAITRKLVQAHGGEIDVESVVGEGTVFTLGLPMGGRV